MNICYLITARGGSKGVPRKNLATVGGLSLVGWKALNAWACDDRCHLFVSSDDVDIITEARAHGAESPFVRPQALATDEASSTDVISHFLDEMGGRGKNYDAIMLLEPSSPFATGADMRKAVEMMEDLDADLVCGMRRVEVHPTFVGPQRASSSIEDIVIEIQDLGNESTRRQDFANQWTMNGSIYLFSTKMFRKTGSIYGGRPNKCFGLMLDRWHSIEIDHPEDLALAHYAFDQGYVKRPTATPSYMPGEYRGL